MFINLSNHPSKYWNQSQYQAATQYGDIVDLMFPQIDPTASTHDVNEIVIEYFNKIEEIRKKNHLETNEVTIMVSGEFTFTYLIVGMLKENNYRPVCACTKRETIENNENGITIKVAKFAFVQFREY